MTKTEMFWVVNNTTRSELTTRMLEGLNEFARKLHECVLSQQAIDRLPERFEELQNEIVEKAPRLKKVQDIHLTQPCDRIPGWLTADGVTLLTITPVRAVVLAPEEAKQLVIKRTDKKVS